MQDRRMPKPRVTIDEISKRTGLSRGTVSRALNDRADISAATKERVLSECRKLNFSPSPTARALATGRSFTIGLLVGEEVRSGYLADVLVGAVRRAAGSGYAVALAEAPRDGSSQTIESLADRRVDGLLLAAPLSGTALETARAVFEATGRIVALFSEGRAEWDAVVPDERAAGRLAAMQVLPGLAGSAVFVDDPSVPGNAERLAGFVEACREREVEPELVTVGGLERLDRRLSRAGGIAGVTDGAALRAMSCLDGDRRVGEDVRIIGLGNEGFGAAALPPLSSIDLNGGEAGARAAGILIDRIVGGGVTAPQRIQVAPRVVARESTRGGWAAG